MTEIVHTVLDTIWALALDALAPLAPEVIEEPSADPTTFPSLGLVDGGYIVLDREEGATRYEWDVTVEGHVQGTPADDGDAPDEAPGLRDPAVIARNVLHAAVVRALMVDGALGDAVELVDDADLRKVTGQLTRDRRLSFFQDFKIQFTTARGDPARLS